MTYVITFNANDGSENPATKTQSFTAGTPQNLKTIAELGFTKCGFNFAGWGVSAGASQASYADGTSYTASANITFYALWSVIPVYNVNISVNPNGSVTATPATATAGTEITLSNTANAGYEFASYTVTSADGTAIAVTDGKFTMPAKNVTVKATFNAINYNINVGTAENGSVEASPTTATVGTSVTLEISPASGYKLDTLTVIDDGGASVTVKGTGNSRTFTMPAKNITVTATFAVLSIPTVPQNVTAKASGVYCIDVSWSAVDDAASYTVYYRPKGEERFGTTSNIRYNGTKATVPYLREDTVYEFYVKAENSVGTSDASKIVSATSCIPAPTGVHASAQGKGYANVSWSAVDGGGNTVSYEIYAAKRDYSYKGEGDKFLCGTGKGVYKVVGGLSSGAEYYFYVKAVCGTKTSAYSSRSQSSVLIH